MDAIKEECLSSTTIQRTMQHFGKLTDKIKQSIREKNIKIIEPLGNKKQMMGEIAFSLIIKLFLMLYLF